MPRYGLKYPVEKSDRTGYFKQTEDLKAVAKSNLLSLLHTEKGERLMRPDMGCDLRRTLFEGLTPVTKTKVKENIINQVSKWLEYLNIDDIQMAENNNGYGIHLRIKFSIKSLDQSDILETDII